MDYANAVSDSKMTSLVMLSSSMYLHTPPHSRSASLPLSNNKHTSLPLSQMNGMSEKQSTGKEKFLKTGAMLSDGTQKLRGALRDMYSVETTSNEANLHVEM